MFPGVCAYESQIDTPLPSSSHAPSIWYAEVPTPQWNPSGNPRREARCIPAGKVVRGGKARASPTTGEVPERSKGESKPEGAPAPQVSVCRDPFRPNRLDDEAAAEL